MRLRSALRTLLDPAALFGNASCPAGVHDGCEFWDPTPVYDAATGTCSLMCHTEGANACVQVQPEGEVEGSRVSKFLDRVQEVSWQQWVWLAVYIVGGASAPRRRAPAPSPPYHAPPRAHLSPFLLCVAGVLTVILFKRICCPPGGRRVVLASVSALLMLTGLIVGVIAGWLAAQRALR